MEQDQGDHYVTIAIVYRLPELMVLKSLLTAYGFPFVTVGEGHAAIMPTKVLALGGYRMNVPAMMAERAIALLETIQSPVAPTYSLRRKIGQVLLGMLMLFFAGMAPPPHIAADYARPGRQRSPP